MRHRLRSLNAGIESVQKKSPRDHRSSAGIKITVPQGERRLLKKSSPKEPAPDLGGDAEDHRVDDDHGGHLNDVALRHREHHGADLVPDLEEEDEGGDCPNDAENDGEERVHDRSAVVDEKSLFDLGSDQASHGFQCSAGRLKSPYAFAFERAMRVHPFKSRS